MAYIDDLRTWRQNVLDKLTGLESTEFGGKPNASGPAQLDHMGWRAQLLAELREVNELLEEAEATEAGGEGTFVIHSEGNA